MRSKHIKKTFKSSVIKGNANENHGETIHLLE